MKRILMVSPGQTPVPSIPHDAVAHMAYQLGQGGHLYRSTAPLTGQGGLMALDDRDFDGTGDPALFCREVLQECIHRRFSGVVFFLTKPPDSFCRTVISLLEQQQMQRLFSMYIPESYGTVSQTAYILISSALSGGSLHQRLADAASQYGAHRIALAIERSAVDFTLPSPDGKGRRLIPQALAQLHAVQKPSVYFSSELCSHYFTYTDETHATHFVLFDDLGSIRKKLQIAETLDLAAALLRVPDLID